MNAPKFPARWGAAALLPLLLASGLAWRLAGGRGGPRRSYEARAVARLTLPVVPWANLEARPGWAGDSVNLWGQALDFLPSPEHPELGRGSSRVYLRWDGPSHSDVKVRPLPSGFMLFRDLVEARDGSLVRVPLHASSTLVRLDPRSGVQTAYPGTPPSGNLVVRDAAGALWAGPRDLSEAGSGGGGGLALWKIDEFTGKADGAWWYAQDHPGFLASLGLDDRRYGASRVWAAPGGAFILSLEATGRLGLWGLAPQPDKVYDFGVQDPPGPTVADFSANAHRAVVTFSGGRATWVSRQGHFSRRTDCPGRLSAWRLLLDPLDRFALSEHGVPRDAKAPGGTIWCLWSVQDGKRIATLQAPTSGEVKAFFPDGRLLTLKGNLMEVWELVEVPRR